MTAAGLEQIQASWENFLKESGRLDENENQLDSVDHEVGAASPPESIDNNNNDESVMDDAAAPGIRGATPFTPEEDRQLLAYCQNFCREQNINEAQLIEKLWGDRYGNPIKQAFWKDLRISNRSYHSVHNHIKRLHQRRRVSPRKWDQASDEQLKRLVEQYGSSKWKLVGSIMVRSPESCRDRWRNYSVCGEQRNSNQWSLDETELLEQIMANQPTVPNWGLVSALMGHKRSRIQCRYKWNKIQQARSQL